MVNKVRSVTVDISTCTRIVFRRNFVEIYGGAVLASLDKRHTCSVIYSGRRVVVTLRVIGAARVYAVCIKGGVWVEIVRCIVRAAENVLDAEVGRSGLFIVVECVAVHTTGVHASKIANSYHICEGPIVKGQAVCATGHCKTGPVKICGLRTVLGESGIHASRDAAHARIVRGIRIVVEAEAVCAPTRRWGGWWRGRRWR